MDSGGERPSLDPPRSPFSVNSGHVKLAIAIVVGWLVLALVAAPRSTGQASGASVVVGSEGREATTTKGTEVRLPSGLPLRRDAEPLVGVWPRILPVAVAAVLLSIGATFLLQRRRRSTLGRDVTESGMHGWLRRWMGAGADSQLRVVHSARLTPRSSVHLLQWDEKEWLIGCYEHGMSVLASKERRSSEATSEIPAEIPIRPVLTDEEQGCA